jgi:FlaA1/EpsC-like NDP-sugar epimerase
LPEKGSVYVLDMGIPLNILSIAYRMIMLSGLSIKNNKNINGDIEIMFTGLKPGEKMHEELSLDGVFFKTKHPSIKKISENFMPINNFNKELNELKKMTEKNDNIGILKIIKKIVPEYKK